MPVNSYDQRIYRSRKSHAFMHVYTRNAQSVQCTPWVLAQLVYDLLADHKLYLWPASVQSETCFYREYVWSKVHTPLYQTVLNTVLQYPNHCNNFYSRFENYNCLDNGLRCQVGNNIIKCRHCTSPLHTFSKEKADTGSLNHRQGCYITITFFMGYLKNYSVLKINFGCVTSMHCETGAQSNAPTERIGIICR